MTPVVNKKKEETVNSNNKAVKEQDYETFDINKKSKFIVQDEEKKEER